MPHKVGFRVVAVSGEEENFRAKELNTHGPTVQGWQSQRFCTYPQEIIIELESRVRICKIQILSHQYLIASQIKICVGDMPIGSGLPSLQNVKYKQLGYVALSDNERTNFKARELKSIHVDIVGSYVRFVVFKNNLNRQNVCNQVGIVALNVIGEEAGQSSNVSNGDGDVDKNGKTNYNRIALPGMIRKRPDQISPLDDLTFDMYQDPEVAQIIRKLETKKQEAVLKERYDLAKKLKIAVMDLYKAGETLGKYEIEKRQAIDTEAFDKARRKKAQMEAFRLKIYEQLDLPQLLGYMEQNNDFRQNPDSSNRNPLDNRDVIRSATMKLDGLLGPNESGDGLTTMTTLKRSPSAKPIINSYVAYEERTLPSLRRKSNAAKSEDHGKKTNGTGTAAAAVANMMGRPVRAMQNNMSEQDKRQASLPIEIFGLSLVQLAYSKLFSDREEAMEDTRQQVLDFQVEDHLPPGKVMRAAAFLAQKGIKDIVLSVFTKALTLLTALLQTFPEKHKITKSDVAHTVDKTLPELINKLGDKAQRQRTAAHLYILEMVDYPDVKNMMSVPIQCCQPLQVQIQPRLAQGQAELVEQLVNKLGVDRKGNGLTLQTVMEFAVPALQHPNGPVRETAERIVANLYRDRGPEVRRFLPSSSDMSTKKNMIYRQLFETFDRIDSEAEAQQRRSSVGSQMSDDDASRQRKNSLAALTTSELEDRLEKVCIFCNEKNDQFTTEGLDLHYWRHCPMLIKCDFCKQVVEIAGLTDHLLGECDATDGHTKCRRCLEAIPNKDFNAHNKFRTCTPAKTEKGSNRCPLCHKNLDAGEPGWKKHLMGTKSTCEKNPRTKPATTSTKPPTKLTTSLTTAVPIGVTGQQRMKKSQSADRALTSRTYDPKNVHPTRMSRSSTRTLMPRTNKWR